MNYEIETKDLTLTSPREQTRDLLYQTIKLIQRRIRLKTQRMNILRDLNEVMPALAQYEWDELLRDITDLAREVDVLTAEAKHQI